MANIFKEYGMSGYIYDEFGSPHHSRHLHVYTATGDIVIGFDGTIIRGDISILTAQQKKWLIKWIKANTDKLNSVWEELNQE